MVFEPTKYIFVLFANNNDIQYETTTIQSLYLNLMPFDLIPGANQEIQLPQGTVKNRIKYYAVDNSFSVNFRADRIDIEYNSIPGQQVLSCVEFCKKTKKIVQAIEITHPRKSHRLAFVSTFRNNQLNDSAKDEIYNKVFGNLSEISDVSPIEWNHRTCRRYKRLVDNQSEMFNNIFNVSRVFGVNPATRQQTNFFELGIDINTSPENIGVRFSKNHYNSFLSDISEWNTELLDKLTDVLNNGRI